MNSDAQPEGASQFLGFVMALRTVHLEMRMRKTVH